MDIRDRQVELSDSQKVCLRLVGTGMSSKEIAQKTGLSHRTVDQYVNLAAASLGATNRRDAARKLAALEAYQLNKLQLQPERIAAPENSGSFDPVINALLPAPTASAFWCWIPALGGERHDLTASRKTVEIIKAALIAAVGFGSLVAAGAWLQLLFS